MKPPRGYEGNLPRDSWQPACSSSRFVVGLAEVAVPHAVGSGVPPLMDVKKFGEAGRRVTGGGHAMNPNTVAVLLRDQGYSLQSPRTVHEGTIDTISTVRTGYFGVYGNPAVRPVS